MCNFEIPEEENMAILEVDFDTDTFEIISFIINRYITRDYLRLILLYVEKKHSKKYNVKEEKEFVRVSCKGNNCPWIVEITIEETELSYIDKTKILTSNKKHLDQDYLFSKTPMDIPFEKNSTIYNMIEKSRKKTGK